MSHKNITRVILDVLMIDGTEHNDVVIVAADRLRYADTARRHKWGKIEDDADRAQMFWAWCALTRTGAYSGTWEQFTQDLETVEAQAPQPVDPTTTAIPLD